MYITKTHYIWLDKDNNLKSKVRILKISSPDILKSIPNWGFDGSSTGQADPQDSDLILKPVCAIKNLWISNEIPEVAVLCEVFNNDETPHITNTRAKLREILNNIPIDTNPWVGFEQEYVLFDNKPLS